jgi:hypothetical protein
VQLRGSNVLVDPEPLPLGTKLELYPIPAELLAAPAGTSKQGEV